MKSLLLLATATLLLSTAGASAQRPDGFDEALAAAGRPAEDRARDQNRRPREVLELGGIGTGMTMLDVAAGSGWYTEVLSAAAGPEGQVIAHNAEWRRARVEEAISARADRLGNVTLLFADTALTALNPHDYSNRRAEANQTVLREIHVALEEAGFVIEATADILDNPADDHSLHLRDESLGRNTDRFLIRASRPE